MPVSVIWYGERGVVNSAVAGLERIGAPGIATLLQSVEWAGDHTPPWLEKIADVSLIVEVGLAQFGNPDLIIVCRLADDQLPRVIFLEAKVIPYLQSALPNSQGMREGFNSSINGQLSLKYRFSRALASWQYVASPIVEPPQLHATYRRPPAQGGLADPSAWARRLAKNSVLSILSESGLRGLPAEYCHFVALTADAQPFFRLPGISQDLLPKFIAESGADNWESTKARVGWIGYEQVGAALGGDHATAYRAAVATMIAEGRPDRLPVDGNQGIVHLSTVNFAKFRPETIGRVAAIEDRARQYFGADSVERLQGSTSVTVAGRVRIKVVPHEPGPMERILLGISMRDLDRPDIAGVEWSSALIGVGGGQPFWMLELPATPEAAAIADSVFDAVAERFDLVIEE